MMPRSSLNNTEVCLSGRTLNLRHLLNCFEVFPTFVLLKKRLVFSKLLNDRTALEFPPEQHRGGIFEYTELRSLEH